MVRNKNLMLLIPLYNEAKRLDIQNFSGFLDSVSANVILINDGSTDETCEVLTTQFQDNQRIHVLNLKKNVGKSEALRQGFIYGFKLCENAQFVTVDADLSMGLDTVNNLIHEVERAQFENKLRPEVSYIFSSARVYLAGMSIERPVSRKWIGRIIATVVSLGMKTSFYDPQTPLKVYLISKNSIPVLNRRMQTRWFFDAELFLRFRKNNLGFEVFEFMATEYMDLDSSNYKLFLKLKVIEDFLILGWLVLCDRVSLHSRSKREL